MIQIFATERSSGKRIEVTDLYWFEENGVHDWKGETGYGEKFSFEVFVSGVKVFPVDGPPSREHWLNGWPRIGNIVIVGSSVHCAGCGKHWGVASVAIPEKWRSPERKPDYPFNGTDCPLCLLAEQVKS